MFDTWLLITVVVYGGIGYLIGLVVRRSRPTFKPIASSIGCLFVVLVLPLLLGIGAWSSAQSEEPFSLSEGQKHPFDFSETNEILGVDANVYVLSRFVDDVFSGKDAFWLESYFDLVVVELMIENTSNLAIEIKKGDLDLRFDRVPIDANPIDSVAAQAHLRSFEDMAFGAGGQMSSLPCAFPIFFPLSLALAPRDWVWVENWNQLLIDNAFDYGVIAPNESRHGFLYFSTRDGPEEMNAHLSMNQDRWGFQYSMTDELGQVYEDSFDVEE